MSQCVDGERPGHLACPHGQLVEDPGVAVELDQLGRHAEHREPVVAAHGASHGVGVRDAGADPVAVGEGGLVAAEALAVHPEGAVGREVGEQGGDERDGHGGRQEEVDEGSCRLERKSDSSGKCVCKI